MTDPITSNKKGSSSSNKRMKTTITATTTTTTTQEEETTTLPPPSIATANSNNNNNNDHHNNKPHPLLRDISKGMNPVTLMTGFYGPRGERIRHQVHEGALRLPHNALNLLLSSTHHHNDSNNDSNNSQKKKEYILPDLDAVKRPSEDSNNNNNPLIITEVYNEDTIQEDISPMDGTIHTTTHTKTIINRLQIMIRPPPVVVASSSSKLVDTTSDIERIRGGGGGDDNDDNKKKDDNPMNTTDNTDTKNESIPMDHIMTPNQVAVVTTTAATNTVGGGATLPLPPPRAAATATATATATSTLLPVTQNTKVLPPPESSLSSNSTVIASSHSTHPIQVPVVSGTTTGGTFIPTKTTTTTTTSDERTEPTPMEIDPVVKIIAPKAATSTSTTSATATATIATVVASQIPSTLPLPNPIPVVALAPAPASTQPTTARPQMAVATSSTAPIRTNTTTSTTTPADPTLQQQQIYNMEKALLSTIGSSTNITSTSSISGVNNTNTNPSKMTSTTTTNSGNTASVPTPSTAAPVVTHETKLPSAVVSSMSVPTNSNIQRPVITTSSTATTTTTESSSVVTKEPVAHVIPLTKRPLEQYEAHTTIQPPPTTTSRTTNQHYPAWYHSESVASLERAVLSEWFDGSATHRTESSYLEAREKILEMSRTMGPDHYVTSTMVRRTIPGDAGSLIRLHAFLMSYSMINSNAINESTPTPMVLLNHSKKKAKVITNDWETDEVLKMNLMQAVVEQSRTITSWNENHTIDWNVVAKSIGRGVTATECEQQFLIMSIPSNDNHTTTTNLDGSITPDVVSISTTIDPLTTKKIQMDMIADMVQRVDPVVLRTVTTAALSSTNGNVPSAQQAAVLGLILHDTVDMVQEKEEQVVQILSEVMELRMQRIEARLSTLDDVEDMLEAERVALELERRDLYTARCRHWFGGT